jgi:hypothetical protein
MTWPRRTAATAFLLLGLASASPAGQVKLEIRDGLVTLDARDATVREILAEWARVGQTRVVNAERVPAGPVTLQLSDVPERKALEIVLRSVAGFVAAPRTAGQATGSVFDRIVVMPLSRPAVVAASSPAATPRQPFQRVVQPQPASIVDEEPDEEPVPGVQMPQGAPQPGMLTPSPSLNQQNPQGVPANPVGGIYPTNPTTSGSRPGAMPTPQSAPQPGMPTAPPAATPPGAPTGPIKTPEAGGEIRY